MRILLYVAVVTCVLWQSGAERDYTYSVFLPKYVRLSVPTTFLVEIFQSENPVLLVATLSSNDFLSEVRSVINSGENKTLEFEEIPLGYDGDTDFFVNVTGTDSVTEKQLFFNATDNHDITYQKKFLSIFIQTDKAIYQPNQMVKFRAVVATADLLPYQGTATYKLLDPASNVIVQERDAPLRHGVVGSQFKLGRYAMQGDWTIVYEVHGFKESLPVTVEEYKLPKFKVEVNPTKNYVYPEASVIDGFIKGKYTFGQPVKGSAFVELGIYDQWGYSPYKDKKITMPTEYDFDGTMLFSFNVQEIKETFNWEHAYYPYDFLVTAFVTDKNTKTELNGTATINVKQTKIKIEAVAKPKNIKPGLPYVAYIKVSNQDDTLLTSQQQADLRARIYAEYWYIMDYRVPYEERKQKSQNISLTFGNNGIAVMELVADADDFESITFYIRTDATPEKNMYWTSWHAERFKSPSNTFVQASTSDSSLAVGDAASITIHTTEEAESYSIMILARGRLIKHETVTPSEYEKTGRTSSFQYQFSITDEMIPNVYAVVSFVREDGEVIGDSIKIHVQASLKNKVTLTPSTKKTDAGQPVSITVKAAANSFIGLRAIDQSVLLLKEGNDITQDKVFEDLDKYGTSGNYDGGWGRGWGLWCWFFPIEGTDVYEALKNSGVIVLTDALLYKSKQYYYDYPEGDIMFGIAAGAVEEMAYDNSLEVQSEDAGQAPIKTRSYFPETWIWADMNARDDGSVTFTYDTPDTITTWELSSFAVSDSMGLGVTEQNSQITVFRNFFISLDLPPSMVNGEILNMKTTLFNYFDSDLPAKVTLNLDERYELLYIGKDRTAAGPIRDVVIPSKDAVTVVFPIRMLKAGNTPISVTARSSLAGDAVERILLVKPEGIPKVVAQSRIMERSDAEDPDTVLTFEVDIPDDFVTDSARVKFTVSGNALGNAMNNLGNLLIMPGGCGEQTMLNFAPDVYISLYLKKVSLLKGAIKQKAMDHIQGGYSNELRYQREDGSFSAFGKSDESGSTWLTAFVAKCFIAAIELNPDLIEKQKVDRAISFLVDQQDKEGVFGEPGRVIHKTMQGGVGSKATVTMTAYVLIALAEGKNFEKSKEAVSAMNKAQSYLEKVIDDTISANTDKYQLAIVGYALSLVGSSSSSYITGLLDSKATVEGNLRYWENVDTAASHCTSDALLCPIPEKKASASSVEMTAYILLTYVQLGRSEEIMPIVRWLVEQRGPYGGYKSTQDTVMAIQALSTVAGLFSDRDTDLTLKVTHDGDGSEKTFELNKENGIILQMTELLAKAGTVTVSAKGEGFADVQLTTTYNMPVGPRDDETFNLEVDVREEHGGAILEICSTINQDRENVVEETGMVAVVVRMPSGYTVDDKRATRENNQVKLVELVGEQATAYIDELSIAGGSRCFNLNLIQYAEVSGVKPRSVMAMDYYTPSRMAMRQFQVKADSNCVMAEVCAMCGDACVGCEDTTDICYDSMLHLNKILDKVPAGYLCVDSFSETQRCGSLTGASTDAESACSNEGLTTSLNSADGFAMSFLVYPEELNREKNYHIFSLLNDESVYVLLEKDENANTMSAEFRLKGYDCTVEGIPVTDLALGEWNVITVRFQAPSTADVYVNGVGGGEKTCTSGKNSQAVEDIVMKTGRQKLAVTGSGILVSSLDVCPSAPDENTIADHAAHVMQLIDDTRGTGHVHHLTILLLFITMVAAIQLF